MMRPAIQHAVDLLAHSAYSVALTGAGISTPSGIPDFRSERYGLWSQVDPMQVASIWGYHEHPEAFYRWFRPLMTKMVRARPNPAHLILAQMESRGLLQSVLTQNVDSLHQLAGSRQVFELHGQTRTATCLDCRHNMETAELWRAMLDGGDLPPCPQCGGLLKPDVVLFGEPLPYQALSAAQQQALACEVMLVVGTSLEVMPAADLPFLAKRRGARVIIVNLGATPMDESADVVLRTDVVKAMAQIWEALRTVGP